jgi:hypothetical protein
MSKKTAVILVIAAMGVGVGLPALAAADGELLGKVHFATSCNEVAQRRFDRTLRYQHSFWYRESKEIFEEVLKADPECGIAYWGIAQSLLANPFNPTPPKNLSEGLAAVEKGKAVGAKSQRENDLIAAIGAYMSITKSSISEAVFKPISRRWSRLQVDTKMMTRCKSTMRSRLTLHRLRTRAANQAQGGRNPGADFQESAAASRRVHYLIHTYFYPPLRRRVSMLPSDMPKSPRPRRTPSICPPIFTRVGYWNGRSPPTRSRRIWRRRARKVTINCTLWT